MAKFLVPVSFTYKGEVEIQQAVDEANNLQRFDAALQKLTPEQREMLKEVLNLELPTTIFVAGMLEEEPELHQDEINQYLMPKDYSVRKTTRKKEEYDVLFKGKVISRASTPKQALALVDKHQLFIKASTPVYQELLDATQMLYKLIKAHRQNVYDTLDNLQRQFPDFDVGPYSLYFFNDDEEV